MLVMLHRVYIQAEKYSKPKHIAGIKPTNIEMLA